MNRFTDRVSLRKLISPRCTPLAVAAAFVVGAAVTGWSGAPWWGGFAVIGGGLATYHLLLWALRKAAQRRRETA